MLLRIAVCAALVLAAARAHAQEGARRDESVAEEPAEQPTLTKPPALLSAAAPVYPPEAAAAGLEAVVKVRIAIDATGAVTSVEVIEPVGHGFDEAAVAAAEQYVFSPAEFGGVPGPIVVETEIHFVLEEVEVEPPPPDLDPAASADPSHAGDAAQPVSVSGVALERGSRKPLAGVIVSIAELSLDAITDAEGRFFFHGVPPGDYEILAFADEYDRFERTLSVAEGEAVEAKLYLRKKGGNPYETVVEGEREILEVTRRTLQRRQLTTVPGTFGDPIRVVQNLPGLARSPFVTGFLLIRGSNPDDSGVFIDGHRVPLLFHFLGGPSILNAEFLDELHLYPGGFPARYGRNHGGIVSVETRSTESDGVHGSVDVDLLDASGYVRAPLGEHGSFAIAGRRSYIDAFLDFVLPEPDPGTSLVVVPVYYDYQIRLDYDFGKRHGKASLFFLSSSDRLDVLSSDPEAEEFFNLTSSIDFARLIGSYERPIAGGLRLTLSPAIGIDSVGFGGAQTEGQDDFTSLDVDVESISYRMRVDGNLGEHVYLDTGLDLESWVSRYEILAGIADDIRTSDDIDIPPELFVVNSDAFLYGAYADVAVTLGRLRLIPGLRLDGAILEGAARWSVDPRLVGRYTIDPKWVAKAYVGLFHQPPQPEALDDRIGNPELGLERAVHAGLGAEWDFAKLWRADAEVYYIGRHNLVEFTSDAAVDPATGEVDRIWYLNTGKGDTVGLELLIRREVSDKLYGWLSYTLSHTRITEIDGDDYEPAPFDQRHGLNAVASYRVGRGWELGGRFRLATGRPDTEIVDSTFDADDGDYRPVPGERLASRTDTFHQLDVRAEKTWTFDTWRIGAYLDIQNLYNAKNAEATQYDYRFRESAPVQGVPFLPTIGVRGQW